MATTFPAARPQHPGWTLSGILANPYRVGGVAGIVFIVLFLIGIIALQGDTPSFDDSITDIRSYWTDGSDTNRYLVGDWLIGVAFIFFFLPFVSALRSIVGSADPSGGMWARLTFAGGVIFLVLGAAASTGWGALALAEARDLDDSTLQFAMDMNTYAFGSIGPMAAAALLVPTSLVILSSGVLWRWLGPVGLLSALAMVVGGLWIIDGDQESALGLIQFAGLLLLAAWIVATSIALLMQKAETPTDSRRTG